jgi:hypothetical protein
MPIKSYLAQAAAGRRDELARHLRALPSCVVVPSMNRDVVVLVTDTPDAAAEQALEDRLGRVPGLQCLTLVAGLADPDSPDAAGAEEDDGPS